MAIPHTILICTKCRGVDAAADLRRALEIATPGDVTFKPVDCMAGCDTPVTVGCQAPGKATYLFGGIETAEDVAALASFATQYAASETGWTNSGERPAGLKDKTLARMPGVRV